MTESTSAAFGRIFISYRRDDAAYPAGWLFDLLVDRFGASQVFKDVNSIQLGDDFVEVITAAVSSCVVLLAVIGDRWLDATDEDGRRRLDDPQDFVRLEIETALNRNVRVIPILVEGARMPRSLQLPASLEKLAHKQALEVSPSRFSSDTADLLRVLDSSLAAFPPPRLEVIDVTDETYSTEVVERSRIVPVVVQFWTDWCSPKQVGPVLKKLFEEATGKWILARVDADRNPIITNALKVQSVPTVVAIVNGHTIEQFIGDMPEPQIRQWLETIMKGAQRPEVRQGH